MRSLNPSRARSWTHALALAAALGVLTLLAGCGQSAAGVGAGPAPGPAALAADRAPLDAPSAATSRVPLNAAAPKQVPLNAGALDRAALNAGAPGQVPLNAGAPDRAALNAAAAEQVPLNVAAGPVAVRAGLPAGVAAPPAGTNQLVTVLVAGPNSTSGTLQAWRRDGGGWTSAVGPVHVKVGTQGVGPTREGLNRTPRGTFPLPSAFGRQANPGTKMLYRHIGTSDWWVSDPKSPAYNTYRHCAPGSCSFNEKDGENLGRAGASYDYAVVIGYNTAPVKAGAGSAFFVHVDAGAASAGCVETPRASVIALLRWLDPAQQPRITIGYGG